MGAAGAAPRRARPSGTLRTSAGRLRRSRAAAAGAFLGPVRHVYVHVPFCRARCDYCDFASDAIGTPGDHGADAEVTSASDADTRKPDCPAGERLDAYVDAVAAEWERERAAHGVCRLETLYFGGGTPSLLGPDRLESLLERFRPFLTPHAEVTVETNPEDVDERYAAWSAATPVSAAPGGAHGLRVSLGAQSFSPALRRVLGRTSDADPTAACAALRAAGVANLGLDLMFGIPGQTAAQLDEDIAAVLALRPGHVSWYELDVVEGTALAVRLASRPPTEEEGRVGRADGRDASLDPAAMSSDPDDDVRAAGYRRIVRAMSGAGYRWYEVSNFALSGRRARHNLAYWRARPYLGLGPGAVSTVGRLRWRNGIETDAYTRALVATAADGVRRATAGLQDGGAGAGALRAGPPPREVERLTADVVARERLLLAARCGLRVPLSELAPALVPEGLAPLAAAGLISLHGGTIAVTRKGRYVASEVCVRLFRDRRLRGR
jgi:oxygen-independent coproporphyrinogen-3 oxidase